MSRVPGLLLFMPVPLVAGVSLLPEPWQSATTEQKLIYALTVAAFGNLEQLQQTRNQLAIQAGNLNAEHLIGSYNGHVKDYWLNQGSRFNFKLPDALPVLDGCYKPAEDATEDWDPMKRVWVPSGRVLETPIWSLPAGTVLYQIQP